jgi:hypothetical protein
MHGSDLSGLAQENQYFLADQLNLLSVDLLMHSTEMHINLNRRKINNDFIVILVVPLR